MDAPGQLRDDHLILDEVTQQLATTFQLLSGDPDEAAERALAEIGVDTRTEAALLGEIAAAGPLAHPDRFEQSHRLVMRALEVLDRDGWKHRCCAGWARSRAPPPEPCSSWRARSCAVTSPTSCARCPVCTRGGRASRRRPAPTAACW